MGVGAFRPDAPQARAEVAARAAPAFCSDFAIRNADRLCVQHTLRAENVLGVADASDSEKIHRAASVVAVDGFLRPVIVQGGPFQVPLTWQSQVSLPPSGVSAALHRLSWISPRIGTCDPTRWNSLRTPCMAPLYPAREGPLRTACEPSEGSLLRRLRCRASCLPVLS